MNRKQDRKLDHTAVALQKTIQMDRVLLELARFLPPHDRHLIEAILGHNQPVTSVARLLGRPRLAIQRRIGRLIRRMNTRRFQSAVRHLPGLTDSERAWAKDWALAGRSMRQLAALRRLSLHQVRRLLKALESKLARLDADGGRPSPGDPLDPDPDWGYLSSCSPSEKGGT